MKKTIIILLLLTAVVRLTFACTGNSEKTWSMDVSFGLAQYSGAEQTQGQTAFGRLSLGHDILKYGSLQSGVELGIQSGNTMRLALPKETVDVLGGVPVQVEMKPFVDVLTSFRIEPMISLPVAVWFKGGAAYRMLQIDRTEINDFTGWSPEVQAGIGYRINEQTMVNVGYQAVWGGKMGFTLDAKHQTGVIRELPLQQAVLVGASLDFF